MEPVNVFLLGGCLLHGPVNSQANKPGGRIFNKRMLNRGLIPVTYTFQEMIQILELLRNESTLDPVVRRINKIAEDFEPKPEAANLDGIDVVLLEPGTPFELKFHGASINRACLFELINPIKEIHIDIARATSAWYNRGLMKNDEEFRKEATEKIIAAMPHDFENRELLIELLTDTVAIEGDVKAGMRRIKSLIDKPIGVMTFINQYMPDGRPVSWPADFRENIISGARSLNLPVLEPLELVTKHGVEVALKEDLRHYRDEFMPVVSEAIEDFAISIASAGASSRQSA